VINRYFLAQRVNWFPGSVAFSQWTSSSSTSLFPAFFLFNFIILYRTEKERMREKIDRMDREEKEGWTDDAYLA